MSTIQVSRRRLASLDDLPAELLLKIFDDQTRLSRGQYDSLANDIYAMSVVSRHLHYSCLWILLRSRGVVSPTDSCVEVRLCWRKAHIDVVSALRLALFITSMKFLAVTFASYSITTDSAREENATIVAADMERVRSLVAKLEAVETVRFDFGNLFRALYTTRNNANQALFQTLEQLLLEVSKKARFVYVSGTHSERLVRFMPPVNKRIFGNIRGLFLLGRQEVPSLEDYWKVKNGFTTQKGAGKFATGMTVVHRAPKVPRASPIHTLSICDTLLLVPPLLGWTLGILRLGTITRLEISNVRFRHFTAEAWLAISSCLSRDGGGVVKELIIDQPRYFPFLTLDFLAGFAKHLTKLWIRYPSPYKGKVNISHTMRFPHLTDLAAPLDLLTALLKAKALPSCLQSVCIHETQLGNRELTGLSRGIQQCYTRFASHHPTTPIPEISLVCMYHAAKAFIADVEDYCDSIGMSATEIDGIPPASAANGFQRVSRLSLILNWGPNFNWALEYPGALPNEVLLVMRASIRRFFSTFGAAREIVLEGAYVNSYIQPPLPAKDMAMLKSEITPKGMDSERIVIQMQELENGPEPYSRSWGRSDHFKCPYNALNLQ